MREEGLMSCDGRLRLHVVRHHVRRLSCLPGGQGRQECLAHERRQLGWRPASSLSGDGARPRRPQAGRLPFRAVRAPYRPAGDKAKAWLPELERVLDFAAKYWKRPPRGLIECTIVVDLPNWPGPLNERARKAIEIGGGLTLAESLRSSAGLQVRATVFASAKGPAPNTRSSTPTAGRRSPKSARSVRRRHGEIGQYFTGEENRRQLRGGPGPAPAPHDSAAARGRAGHEAADRRGLRLDLGRVPFADEQPRYRDRFRQFGLNLLSGKKVDLRTAFAKDTPVAKEIELIDFERRQMLANLALAIASICARGIGTSSSARCSPVRPAISPSRPPAAGKPRASKCARATACLSRRRHLADHEERPAAHGRRRQERKRQARRRAA